MAQALTLDEFLKLPDTKPASEFINGRIIQKPMPSGKHSAIQGDLGSEIQRTLKPLRIARTFPELRCTYPSGNRNSVYGGRAIVPDLSIITQPRIPRDPDGTIANDIRLAPDWIIEILTDHPTHSRQVRNILHCLDHGTQMGWLIDPDEELIFVYRNDRTVFVFEDSNTLVPVPDFASTIQLTVGQIFSWLEN
jgi:Uma2 family endonuclease